MLENKIQSQMLNLVIGQQIITRTYNYPQGRVTDHRIGLTLYDLPVHQDFRWRLTHVLDQDKIN